MNYLDCQACGAYVSGCNCICGWKQTEEQTEELVEVPIALLKQIIDNWKDSTYYCEAIEYLEEYLGA